MIDQDMLETIGKSLAENGTSQAEAMDQIQEMVQEKGGDGEDMAVAVRAYFEAKQ